MEDTLRLEYVRLDKLEKWGRNLKRHDIGAIIESIQKYGYKDPMKHEPKLNGGKGGIVEGNGRDEALMSMFKENRDAPRGIGIDQDGMWLVPVLFGVDAESQAAAEAYGIDHNNLTLQGGDFDLSDTMRMWDSSFVDLLGELAQADELPVSIDGDDFDRLVNVENRDAEPQIDKAEELQKIWQVKTGDMFAIGPHKLICGDCTDPAIVKRVMGTEKARLVITDPPYGVGNAEKNEFLNSIDSGRRIQTHMENDHKSKEETQELWKSAFFEMSKIMDGGAVVYCFMPQGGDQMMMMMMMMGAGIEPRHELIWLKNNHVLGRVDYAYKHEPILYAWKDGGHKFYGDFQTSILEYDKPQSSKLHPTEKPSELIQHLMKNSSLQKEVVYDPFLGSGTTLVACQNLGRRGRGIEISPAYAAVSLQRMADAFPELDIRRID